MADVVKDEKIYTDGIDYGTPSGISFRRSSAFIEKAIIDCVKEVFPEISGVKIKAGAFDPRNHYSVLANVQIVMDFNVSSDPAAIDSNPNLRRATRTVTEGGDVTNYVELSSAMVNGGRVANLVQPHKDLELFMKQLAELSGFNPKDNSLMHTETVNNGNNATGVRLTCPLHSLLMWTGPEIFGYKQVFTTDEVVRDDKGKIKEINADALKLEVAGVDINLLSSRQMSNGMYTMYQYFFIINFVIKGGSEPTNGMQMFY